MDIHGLDFDGLEERLNQECEGVKDRTALERVRHEWLGKEGVIKDLFRQLKEVPADQKPAVAARLNTIKSRAEDFVARRESEFQAERRLSQVTGQFVDLSLPALNPDLGAVHPIAMVERRISEILRPFGFKNVLGPEIETEYYCFDALNIPPHHPARDMQDTFYLDSGHVLRTHTTSVQARELQKGGLPVKVASFGKCFRNETEDASHQSMFHQFELVWIEQGLTLAHLMGLITHILKGLYGKRRKVRFVPKFYPYTEPSIGPQVDCGFCAGKGCPACGGSGWTTVAGAGMVHRKVLEEFKYDPAKVSGFAFGLGTSRLASQFYQIPKLRTVYENDLRILKRLA